MRVYQPQSLAYRVGVMRQQNKMGTKQGGTQVSLSMMELLRYDKKRNDVRINGKHRAKNRENYNVTVYTPQQNQLLRNIE